MLRAPQGPTPRTMASLGSLISTFDPMLQETKPKITAHLNHQQASDVRSALKAALVGTNGVAFVEAFYDELFLRAPAMRVHFPDDMHHLKQKLLKTLGEMFPKLEDPRALENMLFRIRPQHPILSEPQAVAEVFSACFAAAYMRVTGETFPVEAWRPLAQLFDECVVYLISSTKPALPGLEKL
jgi:hemoglobin-like flavoprotein